MDFSLIVKRTHDLTVISEVAFHPEIICDLLEDGQTISDCGFDTNKDCYLSVKDNDELIAIYILKPKSKTVVDIHPMVIPEHRNHGNKTMRSVFEWMLNNCNKSVKKIIAQFPSKSKNIERFAIHNGFKIEGVNRLSFMQNNKLLDQTMVGITRNEIVGLLK